jgi:MFS transporter, DHA1 family, inner membrane transport protein
MSCQEQLLPLTITYLAMIVSPRSRRGAQIHRGAVVSLSSQRLPLLGMVAPQAAVVLAELLSTSLWFSANAVSDKIAKAAGLPAGEIIDLSSAVQIGFVAGTLILGFMGFADRFRASRLFFMSSIVGAAANAMIAFVPDHLPLVLACRFATGSALAGIYPIGMKLAISWDQKSAKRTLAWLVAMLTLGTAVPHLIRFLDITPDWRVVLFVSSVLACCGGILVLATGNGASLPSSNKVASFRLVVAQFRRPALRRAACGYLGHMWELYAFWSLAPQLSQVALELAQISPRYVPLASFCLIAVGAIGCITGGVLSGKIGSLYVAIYALLGSAVICATAPFVTNGPLLIACLLLWGTTVIPDSPQLSVLASEAADQRSVASALAVLNGIGFALTAVSIWLCSRLWPAWGISVAWLMFPGPFLGILALRRRV